MGRGSATSLAPGFRFHPTDEELVRYYLRRKVCGKSFRFDAISDIDIYKSEPWDLPDKSRLKSRDLEWYFFSVLDKKYGNGSRTNRATEKGYWKTTGKDRPVHHNSRIVGMKKTLVFHSGRAPRGERSNWVMHEYRLIDEELEKAGVAQDTFVLCRIFQKSGSGPKNGEQYGAPFVEEEWDDEVDFAPGENAADEELVWDDAYVETDDLEQNLEIGIAPENVPPPLNFNYGDNNNYVEDSRDFIEDDQKPFIGMNENFGGPVLPDDQKCFDLPAQYEMGAASGNDEYFIQGHDNVNPVDADYLVDEQYFDATENPPFDDGSFLETNDLSDPVEADPANFDMLEEYLAYFDADDVNTQYMPFDSSKMMGTENPVSDQASLNQKLVNGGTEEVTIEYQQLLGAHGNDGASSSKLEYQELLGAHGNDGASSSKQNPQATKFDSDSQYPFVKQASRMLGSIPAPPAFAAEIPTKDAVLRLTSAAQSSSSLHVTAAMIQIRDMSLSGNGMEWSFGKSGNIDFIFSVALPQGDLNSSSLDSLSSLLSGKTLSAMSRGWLYFIFFWVLILSVSFKIGTCIYTR